MLVDSFNRRSTHFSSNNAGYSLYVNTADGTTSMVNTDANQTASIAPVAKIFKMSLADGPRL